MAVLRNDRDKFLQATSPRTTVTTSLEVSNTYLVVPANYFGSVDSPTLANVTFKILMNGIEDNSGWSFSVANTGCSSSIAAHTVVFGNFSPGNTTDICTIELSATHSYYTILVKTITIVRIKSSVLPASIDFNPTFGILQKDTNGQITSFGAATTRIRVLDSTNVDVTDSWALSKVDTGLVSNITGTTTKHLEVTGFTTEPGDISSSNIVVFDTMNGTSDDIGPYNLTKTPISGSQVTYSSTGGPYTGFGYANFPEAASGNVNAMLSIRYFMPPKGMAVAQNWSISGWVNFGRVPNDFYHIFSTGDSGTLKSLVVEKVTDTTIRLTGRWLAWDYAAGVSGDSFSINFTSSDSPAFTVSLNTWIFIELCFDVSLKKLRIFKDGSLYATSTGGGSIEENAAATGGDAYYTANSSYNISQGINFGGSYNFEQTRGFVGKLSEMVYQVGGPVPDSGGYTVPSAPRVPSNVPTNTYSTVTATDGSSGFTISKKYDVYVAGNNTDVVLIVPEKTTGYVTTDWDYSNVDLTTAHNKFQILVNGEDQTSLWKWFIINDGPTAGVTASISTSGVLTISSYTQQYGRSILVSAGKAGYATQIFKYNISLFKRAQPAVSISGFPYVIVEGDTAGIVPSVSLPINVNVVVTQDAGVVTSLYTWSVVPSTGITLSSTTAASVNITAMAQANDSGTIVFTGTRGGMPVLTYTTRVTKSKLITPTGVIANRPAITIYTPNNTSGSTVTARVRFNSDGTIDGYTTTTGSYYYVGNWYYPTTSGIGSSHSVRFINSTGSSTSTGPDTWTALSSAVEWTVSSFSSGVATATTFGQINIRTNAAPTVVAGTGQVGIHAESNP